MYEVKYLEHAGSDNTIANTARVSMEQNTGWSDLPEGYDETRRDRLINYLARHNHSSPFRHTSISIYMKVPVYLARQLMKHQAGLSWNEISRRYVSDGFEFEKNVVWRKAPTEGVKQGSTGELNELLQGYTNDDLDALHTKCMEIYESILERGGAPEQARMVLPQSMMVEVVWTGNLLAFAHVYNLRSAEGAQKEAQVFAEALQEVIKPLFPVAWEALTTKEK